ncbi:ATP-dependent helicase HrpB [Lunatimonas lonarensis]|uniref:ATP-dependent helicase HrpB n=1 Tax=Lunatimonas lonarensis TaxID=1232681 RepID=R7ZV83_9BACT|nr:ATP-dependent helicase HrpB [Lunatimonas lonarensis]EON77914.1 ATP-dependent helicase HrpB [Lunatimonas lonarensis]
MPLERYYRELPIGEAIPDVKDALAQHNTLIVHAPPGAGKSTLLPLALLDEPWLEGKKILLLEPRRLAASSIAHRMAAMLDEPIGNRIGYRIRFESRVTAKTQLEVITEGILTRMMQGDNALEGVGLVIFDEFHERNLHSDLGLALCREIQQILRPDLKILIMSATLDTDPLARLLAAPVVKSEGRLFPITIHYLGDVDVRVIPESCAQAVRRALKETQGDILVFLPGQGEIKKTAELLGSVRPDVSVHLLYGNLPHHRQQAAIVPDRSGRRKVVLATSIAETSLTIEGIQVVIDAGFSRSAKFDPKSGMTKLVTLPVTLDAADQRAGRAGRLSEGVCYRLWSKASHLARPSFRTPEILEADLCPLVLELAKWGDSDVNQLTWISPPPTGARAQAEELLESLGALDNGRLTAHGEHMYRLPCHPRIAHMLLMGKECGSGVLAADLAAILEEKDPLDEQAGVDINLRVELLARYRAGSSSHKSAAKIEKVADVYRKMLGIPPASERTDPFASGLLLAYAYPERIAAARPGNGAQFQLANGKLASISHRDDLAHTAWLAIAHLDDREKMGKVFLAAALDPTDLKPLVKKTEKIAWDTEKGGLICQEEWRIGQIVLQTLPLQNPDPERMKQAILQAIRREGLDLLDYTPEVRQWQHRIMSLKTWNPDADFPDVSTAALLNSCPIWLTPYLEGAKSKSDLKKINLLEVLKHSLSFEKAQLAETLAPSYIEVPSGSKIQLEYRSDGESPILSVRLQELFGLTQSPTVNAGRNPVVVHLLSPGYKPVQVTTDLTSFWKTAYFEVRKELRRRYPKHYWPEDPFTAEAVRGVKRKT